MSQPRFTGPDPKLCFQFWLPHREWAASLLTKCGRVLGRNDELKKDKAVSGPAHPVFPETGSSSSAAAGHSGRTAGQRAPGVGVRGGGQLVPITHGWISPGADGPCCRESREPTQASRGPLSVGPDGHVRAVLSSVESLSPARGLHAPQPSATDPSFLPGAPAAGSRCPVHSRSAMPCSCSIRASPH